jgi:hypothetical protein
MMIQEKEREREGERLDLGYLLRTRMDKVKVKQMMMR